jgi:hypothetical protein
MTSNVKPDTDQPSLTMSARKADEILDHLSTMIRETAKGGGRIERIQGMNLQYWTDRINAVIRETDRLSAQQKRAKRLLVQLGLSNRA